LFHSGKRAAAVAAAVDEVDVVATRTMIVVATRTRGLPLVLTLNPQQHLPTKQTPMLNVRDPACFVVYACD